LAARPRAPLASVGALPFEQDAAKNLARRGARYLAREPDCPHPLIGGHALGDVVDQLPLGGGVTRGDRLRIADHTAE